MKRYQMLACAMSVMFVLIQSCVIDRQESPHNYSNISRMTMEIKEVSLDEVADVTSIVIYLNEIKDGDSLYGSSFVEIKEGVYVSSEYGMTVDTGGKDLLEDGAEWSVMVGSGGYADILCVGDAGLEIEYENRMAVTESSVAVYNIDFIDGRILFDINMKGEFFAEENMRYMYSVDSMSVIYPMMAGLDSTGQRSYMGDYILEVFRNDNLVDRMIVSYYHHSPDPVFTWVQPR